MDTSRGVIKKQNKNYVCLLPKVHVMIITREIRFVANFECFFLNIFI